MSEEDTNSTNQETNKEAGAQESKSAPPSTGIKAVLEQALQSYERLPMLDIIFEKFTRQLSTAFRNLTSESVDVSISEFSSLRFGNYFKTTKTPVSIVVFKAIEWENFGLLVFENSMIFVFVDLLLGGKKNTAQSGAEDKSTERVLTSIEQGLAKQIAEVMLNELALAFEQISTTTFSFEKLENNPNFVTIARPGDAVIVLKIQIEIEGNVKFVDLLIPYKTIEPVKEQMQQMFLGDKFGNDHEWEKLLTTTVMDVDLPIEAVITNKVSTIKEVANLKIGDVIVMDHQKDKDIVVRSGPIELFTGKIGKVDNKVAIHLKTFIEE